MPRPKRREVGGDKARPVKDDDTAEDTTEDTPAETPEGNESARAGRVNPDA